MGLSMRTLLICLLVLALPAQGWAAATLLFCKHGQHGSGTVAHGHGAMSHAGTAEPMAHDHGAMTTEAGSDDAAATPAVQGDADKADGAHKCSACAACCSAGAPPHAAPAVPSPELTPTVFDTVTPAVEPFTGDGLDRPPRSASA